MSISRISIIIPVLNEEVALREQLARLQLLRQQGHELIIVDGGSRDDSVRIAESLADCVLVCEPGRGGQMNAGAKCASGDVLLFLHIDTLLPAHAGLSIRLALDGSPRQWGRFDLQLSGSHPAFRLIETLVNLRSRLTAMATGDQAIFVDSALFRQIGGYPCIPLMEDLALSRRLRRYSRPLCLRDRVISSSRRWEEHGIVRTVVSMWLLRMAWFLGADPARLYRKYYAAAR